MNQWHITSNTTRSIDDGRRRDVVVNAAGGAVNVLAAMPGTTEVRVEISEVAGPAVTVTDSGSEVTVEHIRTAERLTDSVKNFFGARGSLSARITLTVPPGTSVNVRSLQAAVVVSDLSGRVRVKGGAGAVTLSGLGGDTDVVTAAAPVQAERISGDLKIKTVAGAITVTSSAPATLRLNTVSGSTTLDLDGPSLVTHNSVSGDFTLRAPLEQGYDINAASVSGHVIIDGENLNSAAPDDAKAGGKKGRGGHRSKGDRSLAVKVYTVSGHIVATSETPAARGPEMGQVLIGDDRAPSGIQDRVPGEDTAAERPRPGSVPGGFDPRAPQDSPRDESTPGGPAHDVSPDVPSTDQER